MMDVASQQETSSPNFHETNSNLNLTKVEKLQALLLQYFPNHGSVHYTRIPVSPEPSNSMAMDTEVDAKSASIKYRSEVVVFGMTFVTNDSHHTWEEAREASAALVLNVFQEFIRLLAGRKDDELFGCIIKPLFNEMEAFKQDEELPVTDLTLSESEGDNGDVSSLHPVFTPLNKWSISSASSSLGPIVGSIIDNSNSHPQTSANANATVDQSAASANAASNPSNAEKNPITLLFEHYQRKSSIVEPPKVDVFDKERLYGAVCTYEGHTTVTLPVFKSKKDAKMEAARLMCIKIFGNLFHFDPIKPDVPNLTSVEASNVVIAKTSSMVTTDSSSLIKQAPSAALTDVVDKFLKDIPSGPATITPPNNLRFVSIVNEFCQMTRRIAPDYQWVTVNQSMTSSFCCRVESFDGKSFMSYAFTKKNDAKEDCAARIYEYLVERGLVTSNGKPNLKHQNLTASSHANARSPPPMPLPMGMPMMMPPVPGIPMMPPPPPMMLPLKRTNSSSDLPPAQMPFGFPPFPPLPPGMPPTMMDYSMFQTTAMAASHGTGFPPFKAPHAHPYHILNYRPQRPQSTSQPPSPSDASSHSSHSTRSSQSGYSQERDPRSSRQNR